MDKETDRSMLGVNSDLKTLNESDEASEDMHSSWGSCFML